MKSRSVVALATLALGSAVLAAAPATAATANGTTRAQVLAATAAVRSEPAPEDGRYSAATNRLLRTLTNKACKVDPDSGEIIFAFLAAPTAAGGSADGLVVSAVLVDLDASLSIEQARVCSFGAVATAKSPAKLSGNATLTGTTVTGGRLSGDVYVTPAQNQNISESSDDPVLPTFAASGVSKESYQAKVSDKKSKAEKKAAKKAYDKRIKAAKKAYQKALDKAGSSKSKKAAAKEAYQAERAAIKAKYRYAIASYKIVTKVRSVPFAVSAKAAEPDSGSPIG